MSFLKNGIFSFGLSLIFFTVVANAMPYVAAPKASNTRLTYPTSVSVELLGRGMLGSLNFDQVINEDLAAGVGISTVSTNYPSSNVSANQSAVMIPVYMNYYFSRTAGSLFGTAGLSLVTNSRDVQGLDSSVGNLRFPHSSVLPTFGVGYENRGDNQFLFRVTAYGMVGDKFTGWLGFTFGAAL